MVNTVYIPAQVPKLNGHIEKIFLKIENSEDFVKWIIDPINDTPIDETKYNEFVLSSAEEISTNALIQLKRG